MKKNGFTLAEVLITLAIIGVVATITLPTLMSNTQEQQAITGYRKIMNTLNEVAQMNAAVNGFDFSGIDESTKPSTATVYNDDGTLKQSIWAMMVANAQVDQAASIAGKIKGGCENMHQIFFRDGTVLCYAPVVPTDASTAIAAVVDTNGKKAPNKVSTCEDENCKARSIYDQFTIELKKSIAQPAGLSVVTQGEDDDEGNATWDVAGAEEGSTEAQYAAQWALIK